MQKRLKGEILIVNEYSKGERPRQRLKPAETREKYIMFLCRGAGEVRITTLLTYFRRQWSKYKIIFADSSLDPLGHGLSLYLFFLLENKL